MIHMTCTIRDKLRHGKIKMEIRDLVSVLADQIELFGG
jgi:hypothetical protein